MIVEAALAAALVFGGRTEEGQPLHVTVDRTRVTRVKGSVVDYECERFGGVGPVEFDVRVRARVDRHGRFSFVSGDRAERIGVAGRVRGSRITGRVRMTGTIATGQRCESPAIRFRLKAR